jgi:hypothetical protein
MTNHVSYKHKKINYPNKRDAWVAVDGEWALFRCGVTAIIARGRMTPIYLAIY